MRITNKQKKWIHRFLWILFILYIAILAYFLFFSEQLNRTGGAFEYNLVLFKEIKRGFWCYQNGMRGYFLLNVVMNIIAFMPLGFILPCISRKNRKFLKILIVGFGLTLLIELLQLVLKVGCFDVDDMLLNTIGAVLGFILFKIGQTIGKGRGHV
ncbi:MAG: VanZ family protein [Velocimicrobium sp.]